MCPCRNLIVNVSLQEPLLPAAKQENANAYHKLLAKCIFFKKRTKNNDTSRAEENAFTIPEHLASRPSNELLLADCGEQRSVEGSSGRGHPVEGCCGEELPSNYVLKLCGATEYLLAEEPITQYKVNMSNLTDALPKDLTSRVDLRVTSRVSLRVPPWFGKGERMP